MSHLFPSVCQLRAFFLTESNQYLHLVSPFDLVLAKRLAAFRGRRLLLSTPTSYLVAAIQISQVSPSARQRYGNQLQIPPLLPPPTLTRVVRPLGGSTEFTPGPSIDALATCIVRVTSNYQCLAGPGLALFLDQLNATLLFLRPAAAPSAHEQRIFVLVMPVMTATTTNATTNYTIYYMPEQTTNNNKKSGAKHATALELWSCQPAPTDP